MKKISLVLFAIAGVIIVGLLSKWDFNSWKIIDYIIIVVNIVVGMILINHDKNEKFQINNLARIFKSKWFFIILSIAIVVAAVILVVAYKKEVKRIEGRTCKFSLDRIVENRYQEDEDAYRAMFMGRERTFSASHKTYWEIDSLIKNNSSHRQFLKSIIVKIYTKDTQNILLSESYEDVATWLEPGQSYPSQVRTQINRGDPVLGKYFDKDDDVRIDLYPYFSSCTY